MVHFAENCTKNYLCKSDVKVKKLARLQNTKPQDFHLWSKKIRIEERPFNFGVRVRP